MRKFTLILLFAMTLVACQRRPLFYAARESVEVMVKVVWKVAVYPEGIKPNGITLFYFRNGEYYMQQTTANVDSCAVQLEPGRYRLFMITESPEEYGYLEFDNLTDFDKASVTAIETKANWYTRADDEKTIVNPEMMAAGVSDEFEVTEAMVDEYQHRMQEQMFTKADDSGAIVNYITIRVPIYPKSIVSQYWVTIYSDNVDVLKAVRASTSGMAKTYELTQDITAADEATQFITQWSVTTDDPEKRIGHVDGRITTFGFPNGEQPSALRDSTLNVAALMIDNETVQEYVLNVGDKITSETPPLGYRALYRLVLGSVTAPVIHPPDIVPVGGNGGFDATVDDWENVEVDILL